MSNRIFFSTLLVSGLAVSSVFAQQPAAPPDTKDCSSKYLVRHPSIRKFYVAGGLDGSIFSTATIHHDGLTDAQSGVTLPNTNTLGTIRFTMFFNMGFTFNFNFSPTIGLYTGVDVKNIGYIEQDNGYTLKRRTYNVGAPLGFKIGDMGNKGSYFFFGGGLDVPVNFQEKYFKNDDRSNKQKFNEWFSNRTPDVMPYVFIGACFNHNITVKAQYYPNNFMNQDYVDNSGNKPYMGTDVNLILLSVGFGMHMHMDHKKKGTTCSYGNSSMM
jgi:hypothetical protein